MRSLRSASRFAPDAPPGRPRPRHPLARRAPPHLRHEDDAPAPPRSFAPRARERLELAQRPGSRGRRRRAARNTCARRAPPRRPPRRAPSRRRGCRGAAPAGSPMVGMSLAVAKKRLPRAQRHLQRGSAQRWWPAKVSSMVKGVRYGRESTTWVYAAPSSGSASRPSRAGRAAAAARGLLGAERARPSARGSSSTGARSTPRARAPRRARTLRGRRPRELHGNRRVE
jgi:hypothetical protein